MNRYRHLQSALTWLLYALPLLFLALFFFYPLGAIFNLSLRPEGELQLGSLLDVVGSAYYRDTLAFTVYQALLSTVLTIGLALPGAYVVTRYRFPGRTLLLSLATLPFVLPTVVVAAAFRALLWPNGVLNDVALAIFPLDSPPLQLQRTLAAILMAHVFYNYAIALRMISGYWANQSLRMEEAARTLGAAGWRLWLYVRLPALRPAINAAALLVFIFTFTSFGIVLILGRFDQATLEVEIFYQARQVFDLPMAAALSLVQIGVMFVAMALYTRLQRGMAVDLQSAEQVARPPRKGKDYALIGVNLLLMTVLLFAPLLALLWRSLTTGTEAVSLVHYANLFGDGQEEVLRLPIREVINATPLQVIGNSLRFALVTTGLAVTLGVITSYLLAGRARGRWLRRWLDPVFMLPLATSAVTLGFGYIISMDFNGVRVLLNGLLEPLGVTLDGDWDLRAAAVMIPLAHTLVAMPFVVRSVLPALRSIAPSVTEAAGMLGAPPWRTWLLVELPLISRGIIVGATFAFTVSMGEFGASVLIARNSVTMPIAIERMLARPGTLGEAYALSVLLMLVCAVSFIMIERLRTAGVGEF